MVADRKPKIYFYCCEEPDNYQDDIVQIADGLKQLGIPFYSRCDYWMQSPQPGDFLFKATPDQDPTQCDAVVIPYTWFNWVTLRERPRRHAFPHELFREGRRHKVVYMDTNDGYRTVSWEPEFRRFDLSFRSKFNRRMPHPDNMVPWTHCLPTRVLSETAEVPAWEARQQEMIFAFGASHDQSVGPGRQEGELGGQSVHWQALSLITI